MQPRLFLNQWFGKAVGFTACIALTPPQTDTVWLSVAAIVGIICGHAFDVWAGIHAGTQRPAGRDAGFDNAALGQAHVQFLYAGLGHIAKASGKVSQSHVNYVEALLKRSQATPEARRRAINWFNSGKLPDYPFAALAKECTASGSMSAQERLLILRCLADIGSLDLNDAVVAQLKRLGSLIGFPASQIARELGDARSARNRPDQNANAAGPSGHPPLPSDELLAAYRCLDIKFGVSQKEVKKAYRRLISRYHPDRLPKQATLQEKRYAEQRMNELRDALERIANS
jgi:DnaJ like chaperone protein